MITKAIYLGKQLGPFITHRIYDIFITETEDRIMVYPYIKGITSVVTYKYYSKNRPEIFFNEWRILNETN